MIFKAISQKQILLLIALGLILFPKIGFSLGFGEIKLNSYLNEPLNAEIEIIDPEDIDTSRLVASLASTDDFKRAELSRPYYLTKLRFAIKPQDNKTVIQITSQDAIKQPYLEFLVVMSWPEGRLVRGYTLLLDPAPGDNSTKRNFIRLSEGESSNIPEEKTIQTIHEKMAKNQALLKSSELANLDDKPVASFDNSSINLLQPDTVNQMESLFDSDTTRNKTTQNLPIEKSKPVSIKSEESPTTQVQATNTLFRVGMNGLYDNKLLLGSGLALLLAVAITAWIFKNARGNINAADPFATLETFDEEMNIKLTLAEQYILIHDHNSAKEILDEVLIRGNINEKEQARNLLNKIQNS